VPHWDPPQAPDRGLSFWTTGQTFGCLSSVLKKGTREPQFRLESDPFGPMIPVSLGPASAGPFLSGTNPRAANCFTAEPTLPRSKPVTQPRPLRWGLSLSRDRRDRGQSLVIGWSPADHWGQIMKRLTSAGLFVSPKTARKANVRLEHAKLVVASAREHAAKTAQRYEEEWRKKKWR